MLKTLKNKIFVLLIVLSIIASLYYVVGRHKVESAYKGYDVVIDYSDICKMAYASGKTPAEYLKDMKDAGVTRVSMNEETIDSLSNDPKSSVRTEIIGNDLIVKGSKEDLEFIKNGLSTLKESRDIENISETEIKISGRPEDLVTYKSDAVDVVNDKIGQNLQKASILEHIGLGFDKREVEVVNSVGENLLTLRPIYNPKVQDSRKTMERFTSSLKEYAPNQKYIIFSGKEFYNNTEKDEKIVDDFKKYIVENKVAIAMTEASNQRGHLGINGIDPVIRSEEVGKIRVFSTWDYIQAQFDYKIPMHHNGEELTNVYYRAVSERNVAAIMVKPFIKDNKVITDVGAYKNVLGNLQTRLEGAGHKLAEVNAMPSWTPNAHMKLIVALGVVAAGVILLERMFRISDRLSWILFGLGAVASVLFFGLLKKESLGNVIFNLGAIVVYPSLAVAMVLENYNSIRRKVTQTSLSKVFMHGSIILLAAILITMIGALNEVAFMSGTNYLLEINIFKGVKISQLLPILIAIILFAAYVGFDRKDEEVALRPRELGVILNKNVKVWEILIGVAVLGVLGIFILRGGNTDTKVPTLELLFRNAMENYLPARPRNKAIFAGFPAIFLLMYIAYNKKFDFASAVLVLLTSIGMADIVNTFSHIRTPLVVSFKRVGVEYVVALIISFLILAIIYVSRKGYEKYIEK